ncbi:hypothetical protein [Nostocoides australiense]|uniref:hypothetical protein n=1 Tax=Nostocoides australiense TaxID=99480 RepID=UPI0019151D13|nr:hypothetical protein [Tetrasphaera australiensis]
MAGTLLIARNPEPDSTLPYLLRIPLGDGIVLRARETWPRTAKVYCHRHGAPWPDDAEVLEELPLTSCVPRGAAIDIVVARARESRSQFVITRARGRDDLLAVTEDFEDATANVSLPTSRAAGIVDIAIIVDTRER